MEGSRRYFKLTLLRIFYRLCYITSYRISCFILYFVLFFLVPGPFLIPIKFPRPLLILTNVLKKQRQYFISLLSIVRKSREF